MSEEGMCDGKPICLGVNDALEENTVTGRAFQARFGFLASDGEKGNSVALDWVRVNR